MKQTIQTMLRIFLLVILSVFLFLGCEKADDSPIGFEIVPDTVTSTGLAYRITRRTESCTFGDDYTLEMQEKGEWLPVPYAETADMFGFNAVEHILSDSDKTTEMTADWSLLYGELRPGHYRIVKGFSYGQPNASGEKITLYAEFDIPSP